MDVETLTLLNQHYLQLREDIKSQAREVKSELNASLSEYKLDVKEFKLETKQELQDLKQFKWRSIGILTGAFAVVQALITVLTNK